MLKLAPLSATRQSAMLRHRRVCVPSRQYGGGVTSENSSGRARVEWSWGGVGWGTSSGRLAAWRQTLDLRVYDKEHKLQVGRIYCWKVNLHTCTTESNLYIPYNNKQYLNSLQLLTFLASIALTSYFLNRQIHTSGIPMNMVGATSDTFPHKSKTIFIRYITITHYDWYWCYKVTVYGSYKTVSPIK